MTDCGGFPWRAEVAIAARLLLGLQYYLVVTCIIQYRRLGLQWPRTLPRVTAPVLAQGFDTAVFVLCAVATVFLLGLVQVSRLLAFARIVVIRSPAVEANSFSSTCCFMPTLGLLRGLRAGLMVWGFRVWLGAGTPAGHEQLLGVMSTLLLSDEGAALRLEEP